MSREMNFIINLRRPWLLHRRHLIDETLDFFYDLKNEKNVCSNLADGDAALPGQFFLGLLAGVGVGQM